MVRFNNIAASYTNDWPLKGGNSWRGALIYQQNIRIRKFNEPLSEKIDEAGVRVLAHKLAGYQIQSTPAPQFSSVEIQLSPEIVSAKPKIQRLPKIGRYY